MKEAIEKVIIELETRRKLNEESAENFMLLGNKYMQGVNSGREMAYQASVNQLKAVIDTCDSQSKADPCQP